MGFDIRQRKALRAKLRYANVRTRVHNGMTRHYIEGWQAIAEANRIFGPENWDRETRAPTCIWSDRQRGHVQCLYSSQVRITVRAGDTTVTRDGVGTGFGRAASPETAHETAMKAAETDATKRALATFGNPFGLALYDKNMAQVTRPTAHSGQHRSSTTDRPKIILTERAGHQRHLSSADDLVEAVAQALPELQTIDAAYAYWENNLATFAAVLERDPAGGRAAIDAITVKLKSRLQELSGTATDEGAPARSERPAPDDDRPSDAAATSETMPPTRPKERRVRDAQHLAFVARHPCLVCGRRPSHAHHIRYAQPRAMALKVSDEFTVPLCVGHHDSVHRTGDERAWWAARKIDPLAVARQFWTTTDKGVELPQASTPECAEIDIPSPRHANAPDAQENP